MSIVSITLTGIFFLQSTAQTSSAIPPAPPAGTAAIQQATAAFKAGSTAFAKGDLIAARHAFERAVRLAPGVSAAHVALGSVLLAIGDNVTAIKELQLALRLAPEDPNALLSLALAFSATHQDQQAVATLRHLNQLNPPADTLAPKDVALPLATSLAATGDLSGAGALLNQSIATAPADAVLTDALGTVQALQRNFAGADETFRRAISLDGSLASAYFHLGSLELDTGQLPRSVTSLERACALQPRSIPFTLQLARALVETHRETDAITLLRKALDATSPISPDAIDLRYRLALAFQAAEDLPHALPLFSEVLKSRPDDPEVLTNAGLAHVQTGDAAGSIALYLRAMKLTPFNPTLHEDLGVAYLQQSNLDQALSEFRAGLALDPDSPQLHYDLALALKLKDDLTAAIPEFQRAAALDPSLPDPPFTLGILFMQQSRFAEAATSFEKTLALNPSNSDAWATLGSIYRQMNQPEKAVPALERAIALAPEQPSPHITLAAILAAQGKKDDAAHQRKIAADLTRVAVNRQKASFSLDSGSLLLKRGQVVDAIVQFENAIIADPNSAPAHTALATALDQAGRKADAAEERRKALALSPPSLPAAP